MNRIDGIFQQLRSSGRKALMPFITAGYPSLDDTIAAIPALEAAGASVIELGIPFSDPIADGPVIAAAMHQALQKGVTPRAVFDAVQKVRGRTKAGLVAMVSHSIIERMGAARFVADAAAAGFDGLIVPDIDFAIADQLAAACSSAGLTFTLLIAPTTAPDRIRQIVKRCTGFVYVLARTGITGEREQSPEIAQRVQLIRSFTKLPIAVGFGISRPEHVAAVTASADAAIVGSALVRRMGEAADPAAAAREFTAALAGALVTASSPHETSTR